MRDTSGSGHKMGVTFVLGPTHQDVREENSEYKQTLMCPATMKRSESVHVFTLHERVLNGPRHHDKTQHQMDNTFSVVRGGGGGAHHGHHSATVSLRPMS